MDGSQKKNAKVVDKNKMYAIVLFPNEKRKDKKLIELVPNSWLSQEKNDEWKCYYPPKDDIYVSTLIKQGKPPNISWKLYKVEIIKTAVNYDQGLRRLDRAYLDANIESTSAYSDESREGNNSEDAANGSDQHEDVSSTTSSSPKKFEDTITQNQRSIDYPQKPYNEVSTCDDNVHSSIRTNVDGSDIIHETSSDSEDYTLLQGTQVTNNGRKNRGKKRKKISKPAQERSNCSLENDLSCELNKRLDRSDEQMQKYYKSLSKQIKGAKQSILYDFTKKIDAIKNTIIVNRGPGLGKSLKKYKEQLGVKLPIENYEVFIEFDSMLKDNDDKEAALREIMVDCAGTITQPREAVRKILGGLIMKAVQELYSGTGRKGPNGVTKKNFSGTHVYAVMKDVIQDKLEKCDAAAILSATSRYLSGAGDREGGKSQREAKKDH